MTFSELSIKCYWRYCTQLQNYIQRSPCDKSFFEFSSRKKKNLLYNWICIFYLARTRKWCNPTCFLFISWLPKKFKAKFHARTSHLRYLVDLSLLHCYDHFYSVQFYKQLLVCASCMPGTAPFLLCPSFLNGFKYGACFNNALFCKFYLYPIPQGSWK